MNLIPLCIPFLICSRSRQKKVQLLKLKFVFCNDFELNILFKNLNWWKNCCKLKKFNKPYNINNIIKRRDFLLNLKKSRWFYESLREKKYKLYNNNCIVLHKRGIQNEDVRVSDGGGMIINCEQ